MRSEQEVSEAFYELMTLKGKHPSGIAETILYERACTLAWVLEFKEPQEVVPSEERLKFLAHF